MLVIVEGFCKLSIVWSGFYSYRNILSFFKQFLKAKSGNRNSNKINGRKLRLNLPPFIQA
jgi:hypothetical protein